MDGRNARQILALAVLGHLAVTFVHGAAHAGAQVPMTLPANLFIYLVILAGPLAGLWLARSRPRAGGWLVAATMAGALVFGIVNHFVISSPDHVNHVAADWRMLFGSTAVLLVITEGIGTAAGAWLRRRLRPPEARPGTIVVFRRRIRIDRRRRMLRALRGRRRSRRDRVVLPKAVDAQRARGHSGSSGRVRHACGVVATLAEHVIHQLTASQSRPASRQQLDATACRSTHIGLSPLLPPARSVVGARSRCFRSRARTSRPQPGGGRR
jgi:hypothetical protein